MATLANQISIDMITDLLFGLGAAQDTLAEKAALDELDAQLGNNVVSAVQESTQVLYSAATSDLDRHRFCAPDLRFTAIPPTLPEGDAFTYTVSLNSAPSVVAVIAITSDNPDATVSPASLTFTSNDWYIPKTVAVRVVEDADGIDESVSLRHVVAGYGGGMIQNLRFEVTDHVRNRVPERINTIPDQSLMVGDSSTPIDLSIYFHDPDGNPLTYTVVSSSPNVATTQRVGSQLTIWTLNAGNTTVTVTGTDPGGLSATQAFDVTVTAAEPPPARPMPQGLSVGDSIIVQNTGIIGLNIRSEARVKVTRIPITEEGKPTMGQQELSEMDLGKMPRDARGGKWNGMLPIKWCGEVRLPRITAAGV